MSKTIYIVRVTVGDGANKFRDVTFDNEPAMLRFKEMAEEDGSYWGLLTQLKGDEK